ncbi:MAG: sigma-54-dependent Fis family transcriptional regulator, partial [Gemmatimonadetes bacterium]|nr:sigma-54-dependent Fis family transcriptional regulator [Gemmatimonadota bacterium]
MMKPVVLVVEDDRSSRDALLQWLERENVDPRGVETLAEADAALEAESPDLVLLDIDLPDGSGLDLMDRIPDHAGVVIISGNATVDRTVEAMRGGAIDILQKPVDLKRLRRLLLHVRDTRALRDEVRSLRGALKELGHFGPMIGTSPRMKELYGLIEKVAPTDATVLISGETGTGKELVAAAVHSFSERRDAPFLPINCGAVAPNLIESELFGHERGSFTGADKQHRGVFERAAAGTLFLDEVTEMPEELQVKLLRVLETGEFRRIGGTEALQSDVRIVAATNRDPEEAVREGKLREDLLFRLKVFPL